MNFLDRILRRGKTEEKKPPFLRAVGEIEISRDTTIIIKYEALAEPEIIDDGEKTLQGRYLISLKAPKKELRRFIDANKIVGGVIHSDNSIMLDAMPVGVGISLTYNIHNLTDLMRRAFSLHIPAQSIYQLIERDIKTQLPALPGHSR